MSESNKQRVPRGKRLWAVVVAIGVVAATASLAVAQGAGKSPDGTPAAAPAQPAALLTTVCGPSVQSIVRTENAASSTNSTAFVVVPGAVTSVSVSAGTTRCIKVVFTGEAACSQTTTGTSNDFCYVRALDNGIEMNPQGASLQVFDSEHFPAEAHAYEWVRRVGPGPHTIVIQRRVALGSTTFSLDDWTFDVQLLG